MTAGAGLFVVTGSSRGLGKALAARLVAEGHTVLGIARRTSTSAALARIIQWTADLADPAPVGERLAQWLAGQPGEAFAHATLVNNAGALSRVGPVDATDAADLVNALRVGLEAPVVLTAAFLRATAAWPVPRRVLNVSSGLGRRPMAGSASYCAAKAGLDLFTRSVALDEAARAHGARLVSLAPGVIDTDMQQQLRTSDPAGFPDLPRFQGLHAEGQLVSADDTAARLLAYLARPDFGHHPVADIRDA